MRSRFMNAFHSPTIQDKHHPMHALFLSFHLCIHLRFFLHLYACSSFITHTLYDQESRKSNLPIPVIAPTIYYKKDIRPREVFEFCFSGSVRAGFSNQNRLNSCVYTAISSTHEIRWLFVCVVWPKRAARVVKRGTKLCGVVCENPKYVLLFMHAR